MSCKKPSSYRINYRLPKIMWVKHLNFKKTFVLKLKNCIIGKSDDFSDFSDCQVKITFKSCHFWSFLIHSADSEIRSGSLFFYVFLVKQALLPIFAHFSNKDPTEKCVQICFTLNEDIREYFFYHSEFLTLGKIEKMSSDLKIDS